MTMFQIFSGLFLKDCGDVYKYWHIYNILCRVFYIHKFVKKNELCIKEIINDVLTKTEMAWSMKMHLSF